MSEIAKTGLGLIVSVLIFVGGFVVNDNAARVRRLEEQTTAVKAETSELRAEERAIDRRLDDAIGRLDRIEDKIDRLLEAR